MQSLDPSFQFCDNSVANNPVYASVCNPPLSSAYPKNTVDQVQVFFEKLFSREVLDCFFNPVFNVWLKWTILFNPDFIEISLIAPNQPPHAPQLLTHVSNRSLNKKGVYVQTINLSEHAHK